jgi:pyruvate dehydrogenase E1 component alpha subunit
MSDPGQYRTKEEIEEWRKSDPVPVARQKLLDWGSAESELGLLEDEVKKEIDEAVQFAEESPEANIDDMLGATYAP